MKLDVAAILGKCLSANDSASSRGEELSLQAATLLAAAAIVRYVPSVADELLQAQEFLVLVSVKRMGEPGLTALRALAVQLVLRLQATGAKKLDDVYDAGQLANLVKELTQTYEEQDSKRLRKKQREPNAELGSREDVKATILKTVRVLRDTQSLKAQE